MITDPYRLLAMNGIEMWRGTLGQVPPFLQERRERMERPRIGDLVVEVTRAQISEDPLVPWDVSRLGFLRRKDGPDGEEVWWIDVLDPRVYRSQLVRWENATFIALPPFT